MRIGPGRERPGSGDEQPFEALRAARLEPIVGEDFGRSVVRRYRMETAKSRWTYWMPAAVGASIAVVALTLLLQMLTVAAPSGARDLQGVEARREVGAPVVFPAAPTP